MVKNLPAIPGDAGLIPDQGGSHMLHKKRKRIDFLDCFEKLEQLLQRKGCLCPESRFMTTDAKPNQRLKRTLSASLWMALKEDEQVKGD